jgi:molybdopterin molybdotransferase
MVNSPSPFAEARRIAASAEALPPVRRSLAASIGCLLSEPITAQLNIPHAASSAMDGWAVTPADHPQWRLRSNGAQRPGVVLEPLAAGEAVEVVTGSPVPAGARSVLRTEHGHIEHSAVHGQRLRADSGTPDLAQGRNIRPEADEAQAGQLLCEPGRVLTPARAATAAVAGYDNLTVTPPPRVRLVLTGGEVITSGLPAPGQVRDVFGLALPAMVTALGAELEDVHRIDDDTAALVELIDSAPAEVIITTGGTAGSPADVLRTALAHLGAEILIDSVGMRPGHPALLARRGSTFVLGLPGNPLAGFAALAVLGDPLIRALRGESPAVTSRTLMAGRELQGPRAGVRLLPAHIRDETVQPLPHTSAHMMRGLADADAFAVVPAGGLAPGHAVECLDVPGVSAPSRGWPRSASDDHSPGVF